MRKQLVSGKKLLLFVDTGDNCRCPLAIGYLTKLLSQKGIDYIDLRHMGVMTPNDLLPTPEVVQLLKEEGVDIRYHRSRPVNDDLIRQADLVLGFTAIHVQTCLRRVPDSKPKTFLLKEYVGLAHTGDQIHDPMGSTMEIFKKYFSDIKLSLQRLVEMEFITTPPEPKEVTIAPTIIKPRFASDEEEAQNKSSAAADKEAARATRAKKAKKQEVEPVSESEETEVPAPRAAVSEKKSSGKAAKVKLAAAKTKTPAKGKTVGKEVSARKAAAKKPVAKEAVEPRKKGATAKPAAKKTAKTAPAKGKAAASNAKSAKPKASAAKSAAATGKKKAAPAKSSAKKAATTKKSK